MKEAYEMASLSSKPEWLEEWKQLEEDAMTKRGEFLRIFTVKAKPGPSA